MYASLAMSRTSFHQHWYEDACFFAFIPKQLKQWQCPLLTCASGLAVEWHEVAFCFIFPQVFGLKIKTNSNQHVGKWCLYQQTHPPFSPSPYLFCLLNLEQYQWKFPFFLLQKRICQRVSKDKKALVLASNVIFLAPKRHNLATPKAYRSRNKVDIRHKIREKSLEVAGTGKLGKPPWLRRFIQHFLQNKTGGISIVFLVFFHAK